jgi:hypothetical protein
MFGNTNPYRFSVNTLLKAKKVLQRNTWLEVKEIAEGLELLIPATLTILNFDSRIRAGDGGRATDLKAVLA